MSKPLFCAAALCFLLSGVCAATPGLRFGALLACCGGWFLALLALLDLLSRRYRLARWLRNALLAVFGAGLALFLAMEALVLSGTRGDAPPEDISCIVVLGAGVNGTEPSLILWSRLRTAAELAERFPDRPLIVTGSRGRGEDISEAECMYRYLTAHGVAAERVWREEQATSTRTNFAYSYALMRERGVDPARPFAFVTSDFHLCRSKRLAGAAAYGVGARLPAGAYYAVLTLNFYVREAFALANEMLLEMDLDI